MKGIIIIGMTGTGKTPIIRKLIRNNPCFIFDHQNEYGSKTKYPGQVPLNISTDLSAKRSRDIRCDVSKFVDTAFSKKGTIIVFEDATGFINGSVGNKFKRLITNKLFKKNTYVLSFHSITDVPAPVMRLCDIIILLPTNDELYKVQQKYPRLVPYFKRVANTRIEIIRISNI